MLNVTNEDRAVWAFEACETFAELTGQRSSLRDIVCDLLANLLHLADLRGMCVEDLLRVAKMHYEAEIADEEEV
jgi:hypothetical protein